MHLRLVDQAPSKPPSLVWSSVRNTTGKAGVAFKWLRLLPESRQQALLRRHRWQSHCLHMLMSTSGGTKQTDILRACQCEGCYRGALSEAALVIYYSCAPDARHSHYHCDGTNTQPVSHTGPRRYGRAYRYLGRLQCKHNLCLIVLSRRRAS